MKKVIFAGLGSMGWPMASNQLFVASSERGEGKLDDSQVIRTYRLLNGTG
ncbi:hypothetical protein GCM10007160_27080 [Litchfieldella qijiaojingensis]|uniref:6-phosphogluconate dehydrogenase NADP-binding domain-containing protein n=1 Tax=Litchfieldella qijiaojingensis TaxID=980347 RepID=A0ABQ2YZ91_9GAMM|nr:hypothetical protein [Halomonas qijiaojingensis]GGX98165.1 hypothetical protein GCM10007160_27080 [Halomonas qijiaojingensis]